MTTINIEKQKGLSEKLDALQHNLWHLAADVIKAYYILSGKMSFRRSGLSNDYEEMEKALAVGFVLDRLNDHYHNRRSNRHWHTHRDVGVSQTELLELLVLRKDF